MTENFPLITLLVNEIIPMRKLDRCLWCIWWCLIAVTISGIILNKMSSETTKINLPLSIGNTQTIKIFCLFPYNLSLKLMFSRSGSEKRPELGSYPPVGNWRETGKLKFKNPGEPVKFILSDSNKEVIYEAMPASGYGENTLSRDLVVFEDDHNPSEFSWPRSQKKSYQLKSGFNVFQIAVLEVGEKIRGEQIQLWVDPPLGFKTTHRSYSFLWYFYFWPVYVLLLFLMFLILLYREKKMKNH